MNFTCICIQTAYSQQCHFECGMRKKLVIYSPYYILTPYFFNHKAVFISFILCLHLYSFIHDGACCRFISPFIGICSQYLFQCRYTAQNFPFSHFFFQNIIQLFTFRLFCKDIRFCIVHFFRHFHGGDVCKDICHGLYLPREFLPQVKLIFI